MQSDSSTNSAPYLPCGVVEWLHFLQQHLLYKQPTFDLHSAYTPSKKRTVSDFRKSDHVYRYTTILLQHTVRLSYPQPCILPGRYGEDFVEKRKEKLQMWSNRIARHPVLSRSEVIAHFYLCDDEGVRECVCVCVW